MPNKPALPRPIGHLPGQLALLDELTELGGEQIAVIRGEMSKGHMSRVADAFVRTSRAVRRTIMLSLDSEGDTVVSRDARRRLLTAIGDAIRNGVTRDPVAAFRDEVAHLDEFEVEEEYELALSLDDPAFDEFDLPDDDPGYRRLSIAARIAEICRDLGLAATMLPPGAVSAVSPDIVALCAKAAAKLN